MALKTVFSSESEIPEGLKEYYEEKDGKFILILEGSPAGFVPESELNEQKAKVAEFRDNNIAVLKERDKLKDQVEKFGEVDLEEYKSLKEQKVELEKKGVKQPADLDSKIQAAIAAAVAPLTEQVTNLTEERKQLESSLEKKEIGDAISKEVLPFVHAEALPFVTDKALNVFKRVDGKLVAMDGESPIYSRQNPSEHMSPKEWLLDRFKKEAPFVFKPSSGSGAPGGDDPKPARTLRNLGPVEFGKNLEDIASGKAEVETS